MNIFLFKTRLGRFLLALIVPAAILFWWQAQSQLDAISALAFVPLDQIGATFVSELRDGQLFSNSIGTLTHALLGFILGSGAGIALGGAMATSRVVDRLVNPLFNALRQVPLLGWLTLLGLWLGDGDGPRLTLVSLAAFYPSVLNTYSGISQVEKRYHEVGHMFGFTRWQWFEFLLLPAAAPQILTGLSQSLALAWIATIGAELLLGSGAGLGSAMALGQAQQRMDIVLVAIIATAALGFTLNSLLLWARRSALRWQPAKS